MVKILHIYIKNNNNNFLRVCFKPNSLQTFEFQKAESSIHYGRSEYKLDFMFRHKFSKGLCIFWFQSHISDQNWKSFYISNI